MTINTSLHFSSETDLWSTPQDFYCALHEEFGFNTDVCATADNTKCTHYFTKEEDGLSKEWHGVCWMNPPYAREIGKWVKKASEAAQEGATVVCLVPSRTDTRWWHEYIQDRSEVRFVKGRLKFGGARYNAPFPCAIVIFRSIK